MLYASLLGAPFCKARGLIRVALFTCTGHVLRFSLLSFGMEGECSLELSVSGETTGTDSEFSLFPEDPATLLELEALVSATCSTSRSIAMVGVEMVLVSSLDVGHLLPLPAEHCSVELSLEAEEPECRSLSFVGDGVYWSQRKPHHKSPPPRAIIKNRNMVASTP
jgi:hypothetical protein